MNNRVNRKEKVRALVKEIQEIILFIIPFSLSLSAHRKLLTYLSTAKLMARSTRGDSIVDEICLLTWTTL